MRENIDDGRFRMSSAAAALAGDACEILTREELIAHPEGIRALRAWEGLDDTEFDRETDRFHEQIERDERSPVARARHLRLVPEEGEILP